MLLLLALPACTPSQKSSPPPSAQLVLEIPVTSLERSRAFYEKFGFVVTHTEPTFLELQFEGRKLFLSQQKGTRPPRTPAPNIRIGVSNVDHYYTLSKQLGAKVITPIGDRVWKERDFVIADPDGFHLRFASLLPGGKW